MVVKPRFLFAVAASTILTVSAVAPVAASYSESAPKPLRKQAVVRVQDIGAKATSAGAIVALGWRESGSPGQLYVTFSTNGGKDYFRPNGKLRRFPVLGDGRLGMSVDVCANRVWIGSSFHNPSDRPVDSDVMLTTRTIGGGGAQRFMTKVNKNRKVRSVDVACLNNDLIAVAFLEQSAGETKARILLRSTESLNDVPTFQKLLTLETGARFAGGISVTGTSEAVHVAWIKSGKKHVRMARIPVVGGTPVIADRTLRTLAFKDTQNPQLAAHKQNVVLAYSDAGKVKVKLSADAGETWGGSKQLVSSGSTASPSVAHSVDVHAGRITVEATANRKSGPVPLRLDSKNLGLTWAKQEFGHKGTRVGTLLKKAGQVPLLREAWHNNASLDTLRAQYEKP